MRIRSMVGAMLAGGLMLTAMVPVLAHAQSPARRAGLQHDAPEGDVGLDGDVGPDGDAPPCRHVRQQAPRPAVADAAARHRSVPQHRPWPSRQGYGLLTDVDEHRLHRHAGHGRDGHALGERRPGGRWEDHGCHARGDGLRTSGGRAPEACRRRVRRAEGRLGRSGTAPPTLFGQHVQLHDQQANRFGLPAYYSLHVWLWKHNPAGTFAMFNPNVMCPM